MIDCCFDLFRLFGFFFNCLLLCIEMFVLQFIVYKFDNTFIFLTLGETLFIYFFLSLYIFLCYFFIPEILTIRGAELGGH